MTAGEAKVVRAHPLPSYQIHEECFRLEEGDRVEFRFESTEPVDFNLHYHEGRAVVMPISRDKSTEHAGVYVATLVQDYCLMWEAGAAGAAMVAAVAVGAYPTMDACIIDWVAPLLGPAEPPDAALARAYAGLYPAYVEARRGLVPAWRRMAALRAEEEAWDG